MGKGKKKNDKHGKKGKKSKGKSANIDSENDEPDPNVKCATGEFNFPNADVYIGDYCAHRQGPYFEGVIWREGHGTYKTKDGQEYEGNWHNDKLLEGSPVEIRYPEGHTYIGLLAKDKYNGPGTYYCSDVTISCNFENNKPHGKIALIDPIGEVYVGDAREHNATLLPANVLFDHISPTRGILYDGNAAVDIADGESGTSCVFSELVFKEDEPDVSDAKTSKDIIFAKSKKTDPRMYFDESDWYKDWLKFRKTKERIKSGIPSNDEHSEVSTFHDEQWLHEYEVYKQIRQLHRTGSTKEKQEDLRFAFKSTVYDNKCPAVHIVYPSSNWETFNSAKDYEECAEAIPRTSISLYKPPEESASEKVRNATSKGKCLNKKNFGGSTNSLFNLVNQFLDNKPICK